MTENWPSKEQEIWFQAGVTGERERIIKLLEEADSGCSGWAIALIKGETK